MSKLEILSEVLVNELTDFETNIKRLESSIKKADTMTIKFDIAPIEDFISKLNSFQKRENEYRSDYILKLSRKIEKAQIYPKWAVVTFVSTILLCFVTFFYAYVVKTNAIEKEKTAYVNGKTAATEYINLYFNENPKAFKRYEKWAESK